MDYLFSVVTVGQLRKHKEALDFAIAAETLAPSNSEIGRTMESIREELAAGWWQFIVLSMSQFFFFYLRGANFINCKDAWYEYLNMQILVGAIFYMLDIVKMRASTLSFSLLNQDARMCTCNACL